MIDAVKTHFIWILIVLPLLLPLHYLPPPLSHAHKHSSTPLHSS